MAYTLIEAAVRDAGRAEAMRSRERRRMDRWQRLLCRLGVHRWHRHVPFGLTGVLAFVEAARVFDEVPAIKLSADGRAASDDDG